MLVNPLIFIDIPLDVHLILFAVGKKHFFSIYEKENFYKLLYRIWKYYFFVKYIIFFRNLNGSKYGRSKESGHTIYSSLRCVCNVTKKNYIQRKKKEKNFILHNFYSMLLVLGKRIFYPWLKWDWLFYRTKLGTDYKNSMEIMNNFTIGVNFWQCKILISGNFYCWFFSFIRNCS